LKDFKKLLGFKDMLRYYTSTLPLGLSHLVIFGKVQVMGGGYLQRPQHVKSKKLHVLNVFHWEFGDTPQEILNGWFTYKSPYN